LPLAATDSEEAEASRLESAKGKLFVPPNVAGEPAPALSGRLDCRPLREGELGTP
jgi:hypothetical protein